MDLYDGSALSEGAVLIRFIVGPEIWFWVEGPLWASPKSNAFRFGSILVLREKSGSVFVLARGAEKDMPALASCGSADRLNVCDCERSTESLVSSLLALVLSPFVLIDSFLWLEAVDGRENLSPFDLSVRLCAKLSEGAALSSGGGLGCRKGLDVSRDLDRGESLC